MVASAPTFSEVYGGFTSYIDGMHLFAHNAPFGSKMIVAEVDRMTGGDDDEDEFFPFIDTIDLAKQILDRGPYNLPALLDRHSEYAPHPFRVQARRNWPQDFASRSSIPRHQHLA